MLEFHPAAAYWNQRHALAASRDRILALRDAVDHGRDLHPHQWAQLMAAAMDFAPDLIVELGRGKGNSTAAFAEAAFVGGGQTRVLSICLSADWDEQTLRRLRPLVSEDWLHNLTALRTGILTFDFAKALKDAKRVLLFWDAHGFDVAECVLAHILPLLADRPHLVIMHDLSDVRYGERPAAYVGDGIWKGNDWTGPRVRLGPIESNVEQAIAAMDFTSRNSLSLESADHDFHTRLSAAQQQEMRELLGPLFDMRADWFYFSLNERSGPYAFPALRRGLDVVIPDASGLASLKRTLEALNTSLRTYCNVLLCHTPQNAEVAGAIDPRAFHNLNIRMVKCAGVDARSPAVAGLRASAAPAVAVLSAEDACNVSCLDEMAAMIGRGYDLVSGSRVMRDSRGCHGGRAMLARIVAFPLYYIARLPVRDATNVFRVYSRKALDRAKIESSRGFAFNIELLAKCDRAGLKIGEYPSAWTPRRFLRRLFSPAEWSLGYARWLFYSLATKHLGRRD